MSRKVTHLEEKVYELILRFPGRIDQMETRSENACRQLAREIAELVTRLENE